MAPLVVDFLPAALAEGREAREYYFAQSPEAEEAFRQEIERAIGLIGAFPETWPRHLHGTRRFLLKHFPYSVVYRVEAGYALVVAFAHASRKPGYWSARTE